MDFAYLWWVILEWSASPELHGQWSPSAAHSGARSGHVCKEHYTPSVLVWCAISMSMAGCMKSDTGIRMRRYALHRTWYVSQHRCRSSLVMRTGAEPVACARD